MPPREILDSEDDGSILGDDDVGLDEINQGEPDEVDVIKTMPRDNHAPQGTPVEVGASHSNSIATGSTDPSFFQHIYDQHRLQQQALSPSFIPDTAPNTIRPTIQTDGADDHFPLTFITDPAPPAERPSSRRKSRSKDGVQAEVVDLTDVTTPRKSSDETAAMAPSSTKSARAVRTYGKRKATELSLEQEEAVVQQAQDQDTLPDTLDPYAFPDSSQPTRRSAKKKRVAPPENSGHQTTQEFSSSPVMLVPTEETPRSGNSRKKRKSAAEGPASSNISGVSMIHAADTPAVAPEPSLPDTLAPSLYIEPSTLTASQKREYQVISSLPSESAPPESVMDGQPVSLGDVGGNGVCRSSDATVAYPPPSHIGSSREVGHAVPDMGEVQEMGYQSSPDVLIDMSASVSTTKSKRATSKPVSSRGAEPAGEAPSSTRRTKKRKVLREVDDSDDEFPEITKLPLKATRGANTALQADTAIDDGHTPMAEANALEGNELPEAPAEPPKAPAKGKRGRKKKKEPAASSAERPPVVPEPEPTALPPSEPPAKKKRGRPRKSETTSKPAEVAEAVEQPAPAAEEEHNQGTENPTEEVQEAPVQPLTELEHNSQPEPVVPDKETPVGNEEGNDKENSGSEAPASKDKANDEPKEKNKESPKTTTTSTLGKTIGKVQYRVGLSRMSRIAPLLKVIKKPT